MGQSVSLHHPKWWSPYVPVIIFACTLQLRHNSNPSFLFTISFFTSLGTLITWPIRSGWYESSFHSSSEVDDWGASAKWMVVFMSFLRDFSKADWNIEISPLAGSPQRSTPTTPWSPYLSAKSTTSIAVASLFRRSIESIKFVFIDVEFDFEMQSRIVLT